MNCKNVLPSLMILITLVFPQEASTARILAIFTHNGKSHYDVFEPLMNALSNRGHEVHLISFFPKDDYRKNYTDVIIEKSGPLFYNSIPINVFNGVASFEGFFTIHEVGLKCCEALYTSENVQRLLESRLKFDLVVTEIFNTDCLLGIVHHIGAPFISLSSCAVLPSASERFALPDNPSFIPNVFLTYSDKMNYLERFYNTFSVMAMQLMTKYYYDVAAERIARKYFGESMPPLDEIAKNTSLVLVNTHPSLNRPRPLVPAVIDVGGMHIKAAKKLPADLEEFMNSSTNGVIVFSMGSVLLTHTFPDEKRKMIMEVFSELPQTVVCKWESEDLPNKPNNVKIMKWLPQRDILAHPNVVAFVTHGGLLGLTEATFEGVPIIGIPMYGDQGTNVRASEASGAGIFLSYSTIDKQTFKQALQSVVNDKRYKENAQRLSKAYRERILPPLDTAVYWTEYVLKFGGAKHLQVAAVNMPWYQYLLLDVLLGASIVIFIILYVVYFIAKRLSTWILPYLTVITVHKKGD